MSKKNNPSFDSEAFVLKEPVWSIIEANSLQEEREEIKDLIGKSLVEEVLDLYEEAKSLLDIWRNYRENTEDLDKARSLPDPPNVRENLVKQIKMFIKLFKEKSAREKRDISQVLTPHQSSVVKQIFDKSNDDMQMKRPQSAASPNDGRQTPLRPSSSGRSSSCSSRLSDIFVADQKEKDLSELERLSEIIREELELQRVEMNDDIQFLQQCLMQESMHRDSVVSAANEPSLKELSDIGLKLEKELLSKPSLPGEKQTTRQSKEKQSLKTRVEMKSPKRDKITPSPPYGLASSKPVPSPPSSAPTSKTRNQVAHRRPVVAKTYSFPTETKTEIETKPLHTKEAVIINKNSKPGPNRTFNQSVNLVTTTTQSGVPCVNCVVGSNSRKLREMVLECRDSK